MHSYGWRGKLTLAADGVGGGMLCKRKATTLTKRGGDEVYFPPARTANAVRFHNFRVAVQAAWRQQHIKHMVPHTLQSLKKHDVRHLALRLFVLIL